MIDALFVVPGNAKGVYQALSEDYSAVETPTWALLLAESCRSVNYKVDILDITAERLSHQDALKRIKECNPRFIVFVVYGQNVNAGSSLSGLTRGLSMQNSSLLINTQNSENSLVGIGFGLMLNGVSSIFL